MGTHGDTPDPVRLYRCQTRGWVDARAPAPHTRRHDVRAMHNPSKQEMTRALLAGLEQQRVAASCARFSYATPSQDGRAAAVRAARGRRVAAEGAAVEALEVVVVAGLEAVDHAPP